MRNEKKNLKESNFRIKLLFLKEIKTYILNELFLNL